RHANLVVLAAWELSCPEESRRTPLESEEVDALPGLGDDRPVPNGAQGVRRIGLRARLDTDDVEVHARDRVVREGGVGEPHRDARPQAGWRGERGLVLVAAGQWEGDRQASGEVGTL